MEAFREFLDAWLDRTRTSQAQLSRDTGIPQSVISSWLRKGAARPTDRSLKKLAPVVGVSSEDLLRMCGYLPGDVQLENIDPDLVLVTAAWPRLSDGLREAIKILVGAGGRVSSHSNGHANGTNTASAASTRTGDAPVDAKNAGLGVCKPVVGRAITAAPLRPRQLAAAPA